MGSDDISPFLLKLALLCIVEPLAYIYNMSIVSNVSPAFLKKLKLYLSPSLKI